MCDGQPGGRYPAVLSRRRNTPTGGFQSRLTILPMQAMREVLRGSLGRSLRSLPDEDRLAAAWTVACGAALAERAEVLGLDADRGLHVRVLQPAWREQFAQMRGMLIQELQRIAGVRLQTIHFEQESSAREPMRSVAASAKSADRSAGPAAAQRKSRRGAR